MKRIHRIVAFCYVDNPRDIFDRVDHIDHNIVNNDASNLRWVTRTLNQLNHETTNILIQEGGYHARVHLNRVRRVYYKRHATEADAVADTNRARQWVFNRLYDLLTDGTKRSEAAAIRMIKRGDVDPWTPPMPKNQTRLSKFFQ
jgi:hypothetical protein